MYLSRFDPHRINENAPSNVRKRTIENFPDMRNYNKILADYSKLATYDETKHIYKDYNFDGVKIISRFSISSLNDTSRDTNTFRTPTKRTTTTKPSVTSPLPPLTPTVPSDTLLESASAIQFAALDAMQTHPEQNSTQIKTTTEPFLIRVY